MTNATMNVDGEEIFVVDGDEMVSFIQRRFKEVTGKDISGEEVEMHMQFQDEFLIDKGILTTEVHQLEEE